MIPECIISVQWQHPGLIKDQGYDLLIRGKFPAGDSYFSDCTDDGK